MGRKIHLLIRLRPVGLVVLVKACRNEAVLFQ